MMVGVVMSHLKMKCIEFYGGGIDGVFYSVALMVEGQHSVSS